MTKGAGCHQNNEDLEGVVYNDNSATPGGEGACRKCLEVIIKGRYSGEVVQVCKDS